MNNIMKLADACEIAATNRHQWGLETDGEDRIVTGVLYRSAEAAYVTARAKLEAAVEQLEQDAKRMDWLDKYAHIATWVDNEPTKLVIDAASGDEFTGDTWREAIDNAMEAK